MNMMNFAVAGVSDASNSPRACPMRISWASIKIDRRATARIKLKGGYDLGRTFFYGGVGYANLDGKNTRCDGYAVGLGASFKAIDKIVIGAEYLHDTLSWPSATDAKMNTVTLRASYKF